MENEFEKLSLVVYTSLKTAGFVPVIKSSGLIDVNYDQPRKMGLARPMKLRHSLIAEILVGESSGSEHVLRVERKVFGDLRPKFDLLWECLEKIPLEGLVVRNT